MTAILNFLLYFTGWPLALVLFCGGVYFTIRTRFPQLRLFGESIHVVMEKPTQEGSISSFGALMISTASRVGTGNIVGVSTTPTAAPTAAPPITSRTPCTPAPWPSCLPSP